MKIIALDTGNFKLDGGAMFGVVPKVIWQKVYPADDNNLCNWAMRCLLVDDGQHRILIDTGIGDKQDEKFLRHYHLNGEGSLSKALSDNGYTPKDITHVILTHLHFDHAGGAVRRTEAGDLLPAFPNAEYITGRRQWEWATQPNRREQASFLPENMLPIQEKGNLRLIDKEGEVLPGIEVRFFDGHTNGQIVPLIHTPKQTVVFMGDLLPSSAHIPMPWIMSYDTQPLLTLDEKKAFFDEAIANNYLLVFEHDLHHEACTLQKTDKGPRVNKFYKINELNLS